MPKSPILNQQLLREKLLRHLSQSGPLGANDLCALIGISQPAFSRLVRRDDTLIRIGRGRQTLYACHRFGSWGKPKIPVCSIDEKGTLNQVATLHPISPQGFYFESHAKTFSTRTYKNLPYFFEDLRPSGFLGRLVPKLHPDLELPKDISVWTDDHALHYLTRYGWDLIGNIMIGEQSSDVYLENLVKQIDGIPETDLEKTYPRIANLMMSSGIPGSSAAGEHPKFLSLRRTKNVLLPVIVKFSPPVVDAISRRVADLLICEHIAHKVLREHGKASLQSCLVRGENRLFLEMERFDRNISGGRYGVLSLRALDLEFVGKLTSWSETAEALFHQKKTDEVTFQTIVWLDVFGRLIGNSDRHHGNISFFCEGETITGLAPVYDMLPMMYAPQQNQLVARSFAPSPPKFFEMHVWKDALAAAISFWSHVQHYPDISEEFKTLTADNGSILSTFNARSI